MNTQSQDPQRLRALELALQARRETLSDSDQVFLDSALEADPTLRAEVSEMTAFLGDLEPARVSVRPEFKQRLASAVTGWVRDAAFAAPATSQRSVATRNPLVAGWRWLFGRDAAQRNVSWSTLFFGRSLAVYVGAASVVCAFLVLKEPKQEVPRDRPIDRADEHPELEHLLPEKKRGEKEDLRTRKGR